MATKNDRELGEITERLKILQEDISEIKSLTARVQSLEDFRAFLKGGTALFSGVLAAMIGYFRFKS